MTDTFYIERILHTNPSPGVPSVMRYRAVVNDDTPTPQRSSKDLVRTDVFLDWPHASEVRDPALPTA